MSLALDLTVAGYMTLNAIPNGALLVFDARGYLVHVKAYTWCGGFPAGTETSKAAGLPDADTPFCADLNTAFRVGSVSKLFTAVATLVAIDEDLISGGRHTALKVARGLASTVGPYSAALSRSGTSGLYDVTFEQLQLLTHSSGLCDSIAGFGCTPIVSSSCGFSRFEPCEPGPIDDETVVGFVGSVLPATLDQQIAWLDDQPKRAAAEFATYSNSGFILMGEVLDGVTPDGYVAYVKSRVLHTLGMSDTFAGKTSVAERQANEAPYYDAYSGFNEEPTWLDDSEEDAMICYGGSFNLDPTPASGGWVTSGSDMARFIHDMLYAGSSAVLSDSARRNMLTERSWGGQGLAWNVDSFGRAEKTGHLTGSQAHVKRHGSDQLNAAGATVFYVFNRWGDSFRGSAGPEATFVADLDALLGAGGGAVDWGDTNYMGRM